MREIGLILIVISTLLVCPIAKTDASFDIGVSIGDEGLRGFYLSVGDYYRVPEREVVIVRERGIPAQEIPVVLFIAKRVNVAPTTIINLRLGGSSWLNIMLRFGIGPEVLYVPVKGVYGPPYGKAYGYYKNKPRKEWHSIVLADDDVINLVNLKFVSDYHGFPPEEVIRMRSKGKNFVVIDNEVKKGKKEKSEKGKNNSNIGNEKKYNGKSKGQGKK